ncbi:c-type cytochrome domain-containing protein [Gemmata sp. JC717]|uniref:WD40 domain-containing protein n=1 Tax=Gemmata algarum TaxID=2975278 RepID=UPI0021BAB349|nr:c-type cytochrome domain-containing protein [Gemmata algarum]MDY3553894.1 c-type cytochrome domain-containing protein [Gemmata algarum]
MLPRLLCPLAVSLVAFGLPHAQPAKTDPKADPAKKADAVTYKDHVLPVLRKHCLNCHNADKASSDLDVSTYQALMAGGASGEAVKPGNPGQSPLYRVTAHEVEPKMPPKGPKIPDADLAVLKKWIEGGAPETAVGAAKGAGRKVEIDPVALTKGKPAGPPPMPALLPAVKLAKTDRAHPVTALATSPWAPLAAVAGHERVLLYNTDTLKLIGTLPFPERVPHVLRFSRNGKWLLAGGGRGAAQGRVVIWDVSTGKRVTEIGDEADVVLAADVSPDHKFVALGGPGKLVKVYDVATGALKHKIKKHTDWVTAIEFSPDGELLASGDRNGGAFVWEAATGGIVFTLGDHKDAVTGLSWRADSQMLASASEDGKVILWFAEDGFPTRTITAQADAKAPARNKTPGVLGVGYARTGQFVTCGRDNTARVWKADGTQVARLEGFTDVPSKAVFSHDGERVLVGDFTGKVRVWDLKDKKPAGELTTNPD